MKVDYIIVGLGLAGLAFAEELITNKKSFVVFEDNSQNSSLVAGGVYNPVILKRFTPVWNIKEQLEIALPFYEKLETKLQESFDEKFPTKKVFKSIEDQNNWFTAIDKYNIGNFLDDKLDHTYYKGVFADFGFGNVKQTGRVDTNKLVSCYRNYLEESERVISEKFDHNLVKISSTEITYKNITTQKIVFSEGYGVKKNPFFNHLPLEGAKGETINIKAPELKVDFQIKSTVFVLPLGDDEYKVGATFNWIDKTQTPTEKGKEELKEKLSKVIDVPYTITEHTAGVRPTVKDRRPLLGHHPEYKNLFILNGLGTRGVLIAPAMAKELYNHIEKNENLDREVNISRYNKK